MNSILKYLFVVINLIFVIFGVLCLGFVLWLEGVPVVNEVVTAVQLDVVLFYSGILLGSILVLVGLFGALGACYEKKWILGIYLGVVLIFIAIEVAGIVYAVVKGQEDFVQQLESVWTTVANDTRFLIQDTFSCCGYLNASEWNGNYDVSCLNTTTSNETIPWNDSCSQSILDWFNSNIFVIGGALLAIILFQAIQAITTGLLIRSANSVEDDPDPNSDKNDATLPSTSNFQHYNVSYVGEPFDDVSALRQSTVSQDVTPHD